MQELTVFQQFIHQISQSNSRKYKQEILSEYRDNNTIKYLLNYIYNPFIITGLSNKKLALAINTTKYNVDDYKSTSSLLAFIAEKNTGTHDIIGLIKQFEQKYLADDIEKINLLESIISKNLQLGIDAKTINTVLPKLIPTFSVQLANKYFEKPEFVIGKEFSITTKIDGARIIAIKKDNQVTLYTRSGQLYKGLVDLEEQLLHYFPDNICLDGELTLLNKGNFSSKEQYKQTMKIIQADTVLEKHGLKMLVFDCLTASEFFNQSLTLPYTYRRTQLDSIFKSVNTQLDARHITNRYFEELPILYTGAEVEQIPKLLEKQVSNGEEGIMININDAPYEFKRSNMLLKVKKMKDLDLQIIGFEEGSNSNKNSLGAFLVRYRDDNIVKVGSGFTQEQRVEFWKNRDDYIGRIITVQYFEETQNDSSKYSLRFPVFRELRDIFDKTEADF